jgi:signal transduction histidine kinase
MELVRLALSACRGIERIVADVVITSLRLESVDVAALVADAVATARLRGAVVEADLAEDLPRLEADPARLRQALDNLLANAMTHGRGASVVVSAGAADGVVKISVEDGGPGIPEAELERIFDPGVRLDRATHGSGLGLAVTRGVAQAHGGRVEVVSSEGRGTTFILELPYGRAS